MDAFLRGGFLFHQLAPVSQALITQPTSRNLCSNYTSDCCYSFHKTIYILCLSEVFLPLRLCIYISLGLKFMRTNTYSSVDMLDDI